MDRKETSKSLVFHDVSTERESMHFMFELELFSAEGSSVVGWSLDSVRQYGTHMRGTGGQ